MKQKFLQCASLLCGLLCSGAMASSESLQRLEPGHPDRKAILDAARIKVADDLGIVDASSVVFSVDKSDTGAPYFCVLGDWAFLSATPGTRSAGQWSRLDQECLGDEKGLDRLTVLLLGRANGRWRVERGGSLCSGDVPWLNWSVDADLDGHVPQELYFCATAP